MAKEQATIVKRAKNAILYSDGTIRVERVRLSYPHVGNAFAMRDKETGELGKAMFSCVGLLPKETHKEAKDLIVERMNQLMKENDVEKVKADAKFIRDGDGDLVDSEYAKGHWQISTREERRPQVMNKSGGTLTPDEAAQMFYGGCWGHLIIRPWFQNSPKYGKRLNCGLVGAMFWKDDEEFGEGRIGADEVANRFADVTEGDEDGGGFGGSSDDADDL